MIEEQAVPAFIGEVWDNKGAKPYLHSLGEVRDDKGASLTCIHFGKEGMIMEQALLHSLRKYGKLK